MGRGTTGIVSDVLGRNFTGIDLYHMPMQKRIFQMLSKVKSI
jgi:hypothetical protein